jgi:tRNA dimethylallyltransferase
MLPRVLAIVGATGTGKSAVALEVAEKIRAEVVAVDAFTVYRGMDIGTAKPTRHERERVRHHLVDVLEPETVCTVHWFQREARSAVADVVARGGLPLLVGGSGLYFRGMVDALSFPPTDPAVRRDLEARYAEDAPGAHSALASVDPLAAARMDPGNLRRAIRALEVYTLTGRPFSEWRRAWEAYRPLYAGLEVVGLDVNRERLWETLDARIDEMFAHGLVDECRALSARVLSPTARQAIGYAEVLDALGGLYPMGHAKARIKARTHRYAARQLRWFRADPRVRWLSPAEAVAALT